MASFDALCNETIHIHHKEGQVTGPLKASYGNGDFLVFDESLDVSEGDVIDRPLPNGKAERYDVVDVEYQQKFHGIPASVRMKVSKQGKKVPFNSEKVTNVFIQNSHGFQVGDYNTQHIIESIKQVIELIDKTDASEAEKSEAKERLKAFLKHPITSAAVGGAVGGILSML
jgi:hypothetical protein